MPMSQIILSDSKKKKSGSMKLIAFDSLNKPKKTVRPKLIKHSKKDSKIIGIK